MNKLKKLASLVLAMVMALALAAPAFAAENKTQTISGLDDTRDYDVYQIFTGDYAKDEDGNEILSNIKWGQNAGTGYEQGEDVASEVLTALENVNKGDTDQNKWNTIKNYVSMTNPFKSISKVDHVDVPTGYYLIVDKTQLPDPTTSTLSFYMVTVVGPVTVTPKVGTVTVDKKIVEGDKKVEANEASIGDDVEYEIVGTLPENYDKYETFWYEFEDTLSKGLTLKADTIKVTAKLSGSDDRDITTSFKITHTTDETTGKTTITVSCGDLKTIANISDYKTTVVLTYTATLNKDAEIGIENGNPNDVVLKYYTDPNKSGNGNPGDGPNPNNPTGETPKSTVITYTTQLSLTKIDGETNEKLTGAEFTLTGDGVNLVLVTEEVFTPAEEGKTGEYYKLKDGTYTKTVPTEETSDKYESTTVTYTKETQVVEKQNNEAKTGVVGKVDENGVVTFKGLGAGEYTLTETKTPAGYNTMEPLTFTIGFEYTVNADKTITGKFNVDEKSGITLDATNGVFSSDIKNFSGATLPSTGGIGTTIFYVVGGVLAAGAVILLITKRRMNIEK